ncbi:DrmB family protein [Streptomyces sp. NPDC085946]|uniref:DrmB family protein n=1 Tax=Streptomyces sp. NPDC085946 TaxID=3365744 RepID=UPI0037CF1001
MTPSPPSIRRRRGAGTPTPRNTRKLGTARRSQLVTTYGVGAMIAVDNESFIVSGLDSWNVSEAPEIFEHRLARILKVRSFRLPPAPDSDRATDGVRVHRFPDKYSCPSCNSLQSFQRFNCPPGKARCGDCEEDLVPSRFVLACPHGHIDDFPYWKWVHRGSAAASGRCGGELKLRTNGDTASLRSVIISCSCGVPEVSMEGAFRSRSLRELGIRCEGKRPWLKDAPVEHCDRQPRAMQRGSSSVWHPVVRSALSIPPWGEGLHAIVERHNLFGASEGYIREFFERKKNVLQGTGHTVDEVVRLVQAIEEEDVRSAEDDVPVGQAHNALRQQEYERLVHGNPERYGAELQEFVCEAPKEDTGAVRAMGIDTTMLVKRLREVRALESFTRGEAPSDADTDRRRAPLTLARGIDWLPAMEVSGEGVFLRLDRRRVEEWEETHPEVVDRSELIRANHLALLRERAGDATAELPKSPVTPRFLLLHTLAHVLINEWSLGGGYPAAALRERIYSDGKMAGVLIYTATSDSAGSLGGIVVQGEPDRLLQTLRSALRRAAWCSNDPLCMESEAGGVDSMNLAACHACVLLPETSCENNNCFLDRALLVGTPSEEVRGFFTVPE